MSRFIKNLSKPDILTGLLSWWKMNENNGLHVIDYGSLKRHGSILSGSGGNPPNWVNNGLNGVGLRFSSASTGGRILHPDIITGTTCTFSSWIFPIPTSDNFGTLFAENSSRGVWYRGTTSLKIDVYYSGSHLNNTALLQNTWNHVCISIIDGIGTFYINGISDGGFSGFPTTTTRHIGSDNISEDFNGIFNDFRIYNRGLSLEESRILYQLGKHKRINL